MTVYYWSPIPEDMYEESIKNVKNVNFFNSYVICEKENGEEVSIELNLISFIEED